MEEKTVGECFGLNRETRQRVEKLEDRHDKLAERVFQKLDALEEKLIMRLPIWATLFMSFLMLPFGGLMAKVVFK